MGGFCGILAGMSIARVAEIAGVSVATVSRVINKSRSVAPATVEVVRRAMEKISYVPPPVEKRQRRPTGKPIGVRRGNIALLFPDSNDRALRTALSGRFMHGVGEILRAQNLNMIVTPLAPGNEIPACIRDEQVDGVIIRTPADPLPLDRGLGSLPRVWLLDQGDAPPSGDQVLEDNLVVGQLAVKALLSAGRRQLAVINPQGLHGGYRARVEAFQSCASRSGVPCQAFVEANPEASLAEPEIWQPQLARLTRAMLAANPRPDGLFIPCPDDMITSVYRAVLDGGIRIGSDLHIVCCSYDPPRLATLDGALVNLDIQPEAMGRAAVELLLWRLRNTNEPRRRTLILPTEPSRFI